VPVWRARSGTAESWRASVCFATLCGACVLSAAPAHAWVGAQGDGSNVASRVAEGAAPTAAPTPAEVGLQLRGLTRVLPQDPNPVQLQIPANLTEAELRGGYGFGLALSIFSGLLITGTLVLLFGLLAHQRWFAAEPSPNRRSSPPSRRSSPSHR
jgi:hypothetical protein